jgi:hypothetical protein
MRLQICRKRLNWERVGLVFFIPAVWQVQIAKPTNSFDFPSDGCESEISNRLYEDRL